MALCDGTTSINEIAVCTTCTQTPCAAGESRTSCGGNEHDDATCITCGSSDVNSRLISQCDWICNEGFYKTGTSCVACSTVSDDCPDNSARSICRTGKAFMDAKCECIRGTEKRQRANAWSCDMCDNYEYNDNLDGSCMNCPVGKQGSDKTHSKSCHGCPINFYKNETMTECKYCAAGTNSETGSVICEVCEAGKFMKTADTWDGFVWDYNTPEWVGYSGQTNIQQYDFAGNTFYLYEETAQDEIYWRDYCDSGCYTANTTANKLYGMQRSVQQPQLLIECTICNTGEIFIK
jgi:hypothetical protein